MNFPAFPQANETSGMSLRAWFAGQAIGAIVRQCANDIQFSTCLNDLSPEQYFAKKAYQIADAMMEIENEQNLSRL